MTSTLSVKELGHWKFSNRINHSNCFGFVYCISNLVNDRHYIGKKNFFTRGKKTSKIYMKEHSWRTYTGSSKELNSDIKKYGKDKFEFKMIDVYNTKGGLYYAEVYTQVLLEVMTRKLKGSDIPMFYNRQIAPVRFVPKEDITNKTRRFISKFNKEHPHNG